jgi:hypothetical protein
VPAPLKPGTDVSVMLRVVQLNLDIHSMLSSERKLKFSVRQFHVFVNLFYLLQLWSVFQNGIAL